MTPAIAALVLGGILIVAGFQNRNVIDVALGRDGTIPDSQADEALAPYGVTTDDLTTLPGLTTTPQSGSGGGLARVVSECNRIAALKLHYVWGGGHAGYPPGGPFDCSGAVSYVLHAAGLLKGPPRVSGMFVAWGSPGKGQHLTVWANATHVFLEIDGRMWGTSNSNPGGGPGWHTRGTSGFVPRHPAGL